LEGTQETNRLFSQEMPVSKAIKEYRTISETIFKPGISRFFGGGFFKPVFNRPWFSGDKLEAEIERILVDTCRKSRDEALKLDHDGFAEHCDV
jgi:hypothetical protein